MIIHAGAARDALGVRARPAMLVLEAGRIVYAGEPDDREARKVDQPRVIHLPDRLILPALVNAHAHLDLTHVGPRPYPGDFVEWLRMVIAERPKPDEGGAIVEAVHAGLALSRQGGVGFIGDIAGTPLAATARQQAPPDERIPGVSYLECFGIGAAQEAAARNLRRQIDDLKFETSVPAHERGVILGIQPHAPYSAGLELYKAAAKLSRSRAYRLATHLAESLEEIEIVVEAGGPLANLLRDLGKWDDSIRPTGLHPVDHLEPLLRHARWLLAHCNYVEDRHIELLAHSGASVAYCPIASEYFGHRHHRYREMLEAGVNVCLGTDSIICQPLESGPLALSILPQMRRLYRRDGADPDTLLAMATTRGLAAMAIDQRLASLLPQAPADLIALAFDPDDPRDPLEQVLRHDVPVEPIPPQGTLPR